MTGIVDEVRQQLQHSGDDKARESAQRFFKEPLCMYGVKSATVEKIAKQAFVQLKGRPKAEVFALCEDLWRSGYQEECGVACLWAYSLRRQYTVDDFSTFEHWVTQYVSNWASCDTLCNHTIGTFVEMYPQYLAELKRWARTSNRWQKRAAAVTLIIPARNGLFLNDVLAIADQLLTDPDDLVQKGYGWMLKAASQAHPQAVFDYLLSKKTVMPRTAFRYALEKMPADWRAEAMRK